MSNQTRIYVVRHGESESNAHSEQNPGEKYKLYGTFGSPLTQKGKVQARNIAKKLEDIKFDVILSSDLIRAKETAAFIAERQGLSVITNQTIREREFGQNMSKEQKKEIERSLAQINEAEKLEFKYFPEGESGMDALKRFYAFLEEVVSTYSGKNILVVNHGNIMRSFLIHNGFAKYHALPTGSVANTGYFVIETDENKYKILETFGIKKNGSVKTEE